MRIGSGKHIYDWRDDWAQVPNRESATRGWSHHGVVVNRVRERHDPSPGRSQHADVRP